eukprot:6670080-Pyramimonas_sp.AAC.1
MIGDFNLADEEVDYSTAELVYVRGRPRRPASGPAGSAAARASAGRQSRAGRTRWARIFRHLTEL